jgi:hypothetical protein
MHMIPPRPATALSLCLSEYHEFDEVFSSHSYHYPILCLYMQVSLLLGISTVYKF